MFLIDAIRNCGIDYTALFTGLLFLAVFIAWRTDRSHAKGIRQDSIRSVARRVHAWPKKTPTYITDEADHGIATLQVVLFNGSDEAVQDVRVEIEGRGFEIEPIIKRTLPPGPEDRTVREAKMRTLEAYERTAAREPAEWKLDAEDLDVRMWFTDGATRRWLRDADGSLMPDEAERPATK